MSNKPELNSCFNCRHLGNDSESDDVGNTFYSYPYCEKRPNIENLRSFPFKKTQSCFSMHYWVAVEVDPEVKALFDLNPNSEEPYNLYKEKYLKP